MAAVEEFDVAGDSAADLRDDRPDLRRRRWPRRAVPWVAAAAVLVLAGAVTASPTRLILGRGSGPDIGLVAVDLAHPPSLVWQSDFRTDSVAYVAGDRAVLSRQQLGTGRTVFGVDLATGARVWEYVDDAYTCQWGSPMVCVRSVGGPDATLDVVDLEDGTSFSRPYPGAIAAIAVGAGIAVVLQTGGAAEDVVLLAADGEPVWSLGVDASYTASEPMWTFAHVVGDELRFETTTTVRIDIATGQLVRDPVTDQPAGAIDGTALGTDDDVGGPVQLRTSLEAEVTAMVGTSGTELWSFGEAPCYPEARLRGVVVLSCWTQSGTRTHGVDEVTGETLWTYEEQVWLAAASSDTLVYSSDPGGYLRAIDVLTGAIRWEQRVAVGESGYVNTTPISDGLLVTTSESVLRLSWPVADGT